MVTIRDVARAAGVSIATVSRVFNGSSRVSEETRKAVRAAASKLDYWPNSAARSLTTNRSQVLGVLLPDLFGEFFSEVIRGIDHAARREKLQILVSSSHADTDALLAAARSMRGRIDGLIAMAPDKGSAKAIHQITRKFPVVLLNPRFATNGCSAVSIANFEGARAMVNHLTGLGHRDLAMITGPSGNVDAEERLRGFRTALADAGLEPRSGSGDRGGLHRILRVSRRHQGAAPPSSPIRGVCRQRLHGHRALKRVARRRSGRSGGHGGDRIRRHRDRPVSQSASDHRPRGRLRTRRAGHATLDGVHPHTDSRPTQPRSHTRHPRGAQFVRLHPATRRRGAGAAPVGRFSCSTRIRCRVRGRAAEPEVRAGHLENARARSGRTVTMLCARPPYHHCPWIPHPLGRRPSS